MVKERLPDRVAPRSALPGADGTMTHVPYLALFLLAAAFLAVAQAAEAPLDAERVRAVAALLPERPEGLGRPIADRAAWARLAAEPACEALRTRADGFLQTPLPEQPDDLFLEFSRTGNRTHWQKVCGERRGGLAPLVLAECLEAKGRYLPAIEELVNALCAERTWVMPAHDSKLDNFNGKAVDIDLASSALGWHLATADYLLGDRLSADARGRLRENVRKRVLEPYRLMFTGARKPNWWMLTTNNWNAVCLAGVTGAGLAQLESREERAEFVVAAEKYSRNFLAGFTPDGYCSEGLGYWNYGFGNFVLLAETVRRATGGGLDLLARPEAKMPAAFAARIQIANGIAPAFADCAVNARPAHSTMVFLNRRFGLGLSQYDQPDPKSTLGDLSEGLLSAFPAEAAPAVQTAGGAAAGVEIRTWFDSAGILIGRPRPDTPCKMAVALKGGHNAEHHNHNDLGSYVVVCGERPVLLDPGAETYTARTFSNRRYESKLLNSFGHPVPVVAGQLQRDGRAAEAKVLRTELTDKSDLLDLDLAAAYPVPDLASLRRTFVYSREGAGSLTVTDRVEYKTPQTFGTALVTLGHWQHLEDGALLIYNVDEAVRVEIDAGGAAFTVKAEEIREDAPVVPTRLGIDLAQPVTAATVTMKITPMETPEGGAGGLLRNGGFEMGTWHWELPKNGMGELSTERAAGGKTSLKITDHDTKAGSNVLSGRLPAKGAGRYVLRGKVFHTAGQGIGMYVRFLDADRRMINPTDGKGNIAPVGSLTGAAGAWTAFAFPFDTPPETAALQMWIHSFNGADVEAYLDDVEIVKRE